MKIKRFILLAFSGCCLALSGAACSGLEGDNSDFDFGDMTSDAPDNPYDGQGYDRLPNSVRLATYNTHRCEGWTQNSGTDRANYNNTAKVISLMDPDVIALQELDKNTTWHQTDQLQELADRTGMRPYYCKTFRYYSPKMGVYVSQDPIGLAGGNPTLYGYVFDPNTQVDPFGLDCDKVNKARARQHKMLQDNKGFNISPTDWDAYPSIGRNGTFITDCKGALGYFGNFKKGDTITISSVKAAKIESDMGLNPGSLQNGFKIREVSGISSMNPRSPLEGNEYFLGGGQHLPGGAPEMVINSIPTTDNASVTTILTVLVK